MNQPIGVCVVLENERGEVLLGKRKNAFKAGYYGVPGGRIEIGEILEQAAQRELQEEVGVEALKLEYVGVVKDFQGDKDFVHFIFHCPEWRGLIKNQEPEKCEGWEWVQRKSLPSLILEAHRVGIEMLATHDQIREITS